MLDLVKDMVNINMLDVLSHFEPVLAYDKIWQSVSSYAGQMCTIGMVLLFGMAVIAAFKILIKDGLEFNGAHYIALLIKVAVIGGLFCNTLGFIPLTNMLMGIAQNLTEAISGNAMIDFQGQLREFCYGAQQNSTIAKLLVKLNPLQWVAAILNFGMLGTYFLLISLGPAFFTICLFLAPIMMPISIALPDITFSWVKITLGSLFFGVIVATGMVVMQSTEIFRLLAQFSFISADIAIIFILAYVCLFFLLIPIVASNLFSVPAFQLISKALSFPLWIIAAPLGFFVSSALKKVTK